MEYSVNGIVEPAFTGRPAGTFPTALFSIPRPGAFLYLELRRVWPTMRAMSLARNWECSGLSCFDQAGSFRGMCER